MANTYSKAEMTPALIKLNLQYFFDKPAREYKAEMDEVLANHNPDTHNQSSRAEVGHMRKWASITGLWHKNMKAMPLTESPFQNITEKLAELATDENTSLILDIFDDFTALLTDDVDRSKDELLLFKTELYETTAQEEFDKKQQKIDDVNKVHDEAVKDMLAALIVDLKERDVNNKANESTEDLQPQINALIKVMEDIDVVVLDVRDETPTLNTPTEVFDRMMKMSRIKNTELADTRAKEIADALEEAEKLLSELSKEQNQERSEKLIENKDAIDSFNDCWDSYVLKYTTASEKPTATLFEMFLIDVGDMTRNQVKMMKVHADIYDDNGIENYIEFQAEIDRVKEKYPE